MGIRIDALPTTNLPERTHALPAMRNGQAVQLRIEQLLALAQAGDITLAEVSGLVAQTVQAAIEELKGSIDDLASVDLESFKTASNTYGEALVQALAGDRHVNVPPALALIEVSDAQVATVLAGLHRLRLSSPIKIKLAGKEVLFDADVIARLGANGSKISLVGADPIVTTLSSVVSVAGAAHDWDVVLNLADATGIEPGQVLKLWNVGPIPTLSGDNSILLRDRPLPGEIYYPHARIGLITFSAGANTATFSAGATISTHLAVDDLVHCAGQTNQISAIDDGTRTVTFVDNWEADRTSERGYWVTVPGIGSATLSGAQPSATLDFANSVTGTVNVGDLVATRGMLVEILSIVDGNTVTLSHAVSFSGGAPYSIIRGATLHEGGHLVTAVSGNQVTVKNRSRLRPPVHGVTTGEAIAIRTVLRQLGAGDGLRTEEQGGSLRLLDNIALRGNYASAGSHGIALNGRVVEGPTQSGMVGMLTCGYNTAVIDFGRNVFAAYGCTLNARGLMVSGGREFNVWADIGSTVNLRHLVSTGALRDGVLIGPGAVAKITESRANGNAGDGFRALPGATLYGEIPFAWGNGGMGFRVQGAAACDIGEGVSIGNGGSGLRVEYARAKAPHMLLAANGREAIEVVELFDVDVSGSWVTGSSGAAGNGRPLYASGKGSLIARDIGVRGNKSASYADRGADVDATGANPALSVAGVSRLNEYAFDGSIIRAAGATAFGVAALSVAGGSVLSFFRRGTVVHDFPSIGAGSFAFVDVPVSGAATSGHTATANSNSLPDGLVLSARVNAAGNVRIFAHNVTGAAIDPGNATISWTVVG